MKTYFVFSSFVFLMMVVFHISYGDESMPIQYINDIKSGDEKKADEALGKIEKDRKELISSLTEILEENKKLDKPNLASVKYALLSLGKIKAQEAVETILLYVDFAVRGSRDPGSPEDGIWVPVQEQYPAMAALHDIGISVIDPLLTAVSKGQLSDRGVNNAGFLIVWLLNDEGKEVIERFASKLSNEDEKLRILSVNIIKYYK
jgi:hypothetical protein